MLGRNAWGVGAALDSDDACLDRLQPASASKTNSAAKPIERSPAKFISTFSQQAVIRCSIRGGGLPNETQISYRKISRLLKLLIASGASARFLHPRAIALRR